MLLTLSAAGDAGFAPSPAALAGRGAMSFQWTASAIARPNPASTFHFIRGVT
jgi:hypothetical protein